jgi:hypothetical protein
MDDIKVRVTRGITGWSVESLDLDQLREINLELGSRIPKGSIKVLATFHGRTAQSERFAREWAAEYLRSEVNETA